MNFITPPRNCGQIVVCSYACDEDGIYKRTIDTSDMTSVFEFAHWDSWSGLPECDFQNGPPQEPDLMEWEEVFKL